MLKRFFNNNGWNGISDVFSINSSAEIHDGKTIRTEFTDSGFVAKRDYFEIKSKEEKIEQVYTRQDTVTNTEKDTLHIYDYRYRFTFPGEDYEVYTMYNNWCNESRGTWMPLTTAIEASSKSPRTNDSHAPMLALYDKQTKRGIVFHLYTNCSWKMKAVKYSPNCQLIFTMIEISPCDDALDISVNAGESFTMPKVAFYEFTNKDDLDSYKLHKYLVKTNPRKKLPVIYNTWLSFFDKVDFEKITSQIPEAADIGCDYFVLDAGWFGKDGSWSYSVGDWKENKNGAYGGRMKEISDLVHKTGMKFGLWLEPERAVYCADIVKEHPEYFFDSNNFSYFLDFANDDARKYITDVTISLAKEYNIDFFKFDFNDSLTFDNTRKAFFDYHRGFAKYIEDVRSACAGIYLEGCASGGFVSNIYNMQLYDSVWLSDNQSVYETLRIFKDSIRYMSPCFMEKWGSFLSVGDKFSFCGGEKEIRHFSTDDGTWKGIVNFYEDWLDGFFAGSPVGISTVLTEISPQLKQKLKDIIAKFKKDEPFWRNAAVRILTDTQKVLALQYETDDEIRVVVYTGKPVVQDSVTVYPVTDGKFSFDGREYKDEGIKIENPSERTSYIFKLERIK